MTTEANGIPSGVLPDEVWHDMLFLNSLESDASEPLNSGDLSRARQIMVRVYRERAYRAAASEMSRIVFYGAFEAPDITDAPGGDPLRSVRAHIDAILESHTSIADLPEHAAPGLASSLTPALRSGAVDGDSVIPGDAKAASTRLLRGESTPLVFTLARTHSRDGTQSAPSAIGPWRMRPHLAHGALVSLAAGAADAVDVLNVRDQAKSTLRSARIDLVDKGATIRVSGLPPHVDARTLRMRVERTLLRPDAPSTRDTALFGWTAAVDAASPVPVTLEAELFEPAAAEGIEDEIRRSE